MSTLIETLRDQVVARLEADEHPPGTLLPSFREMQGWVGARGVGTVQAALQPLIDVGLLRAEHGRGVRVVDWPGDARQRRALAQLGALPPSEPHRAEAQEPRDEELSAAVETAADALTAAADSLRDLATRLRTS